MAVARIGDLPVTEQRILLPRFGLEMAGFLTVLLGAWTGLVSFVGPVFGYSGDGSAAWHWDSAHVYLFLIPGAAAFLAGLFVMIATVGAERAVVGMCGTFAVLAGAWLIVGPVAWHTLSGGGFFRANLPATSLLAYWVGYSLGPGGLLIALGAFIVGSDRPRVVSKRIATAAPASGAAPTATPTAGVAEPF